MKKLIDVMYYYHYLWNKAVSYTNNSDIYSLISLAGIISFYIMSIFEIIVVGYFKMKLEYWHMGVIFIFVIISLYFYLIRSNRVEKILDIKPKFFNNNTITAIIVLIITLGSFVTLIVTTTYLRENFPVKNSG
jgi:hypothetical protein